MFVWGAAPSPVSLSVMSPACPPSSCPCARQPHPSVGPRPLSLLFSHRKPVTVECGLFGLSCVKWSHCLRAGVTGSVLLYHCKPLWTCKCVHCFLTALLVEKRDRCLPGVEGRDRSQGAELWDVPSPVSQPLDRRSLGSGPGGRDTYRASCTFTAASWQSCRPACSATTLIILLKS